MLVAFLIHCTPLVQNTSLAVSVSVLARVQLVHHGRLRVGAGSSGQSGILGAPLVAVVLGAVGLAGANSSTESVVLL
jgi:hypothetical protein